MKTLIYLFTFLPLLVFGQTTAIPDANFEQALIDLGYDTGTPDGSVPTANISSPWYLDVSMKNITDLTGIADFTALVTLNCYSNQLTNLDVTQNTYLMNLNCSNNQISSLDLSQNNNMSNLNCDSNQLTSLDMSFGNGGNYQTLTSIGNPNLSCIKVADSVFSTWFWAHNIDPQHYFSTNCNTGSQLCIDFEQHNATDTITFNQSLDGNLVYSANGINMYGTYMPIPNSPWKMDDIHIYDGANSGYGTNHNMYSNIMVFSENGVVIDFSNLSYSSKSITFLTNLFNITKANPFLINGYNENTLPPNINFLFQSNGLNYTVTIQGDVDSLTIGGFETALDDLCVEPYSGSISNSIVEKPNSEKLNIYPNPMTHSTTIEFPNHLKDYTVKVYDIVGNVVILEENIAGYKHKLNRGSLNKGMYFIEVTSSLQRYESKLIIK